MKKTKLLNSALSSVIARMGHTQTLCIADAGLPVPDDTTLIDLALVRGLPRFADALEATLCELCVEKITLAEEIKAENPALCALLEQKFSQIEVCYLPHHAFKQMLPACRAVVRTGECMPFANVILQAGVAFTEQS